MGKVVLLPVYGLASKCVVSPVVPTGMALEKKLGGYVFPLRLALSLLLIAINHLQCHPINASQASGHSELPHQNVCLRDELELPNNEQL